MNRPSRRFSPRRSMLALEPRIVFDGAAAAAGAGDLAALRDGAPHAVAQRLPDALPDLRPVLERAAIAPAAGRSVLIVDARIPDYRRIVDAAGAGVTVIVLDQNSDGMSQIAAALQGVRGLDTVSIVSHGDRGMLLLGNSALLSDNLGKYQAELATLGAALGAQGELLLYGCDVGAGAAGRAFVDALAGSTGAVVAASLDATGAASRGGNWDLEIATGAVHAAPAFDTAALQDYDYVLHTASVGTVAQLQAALASAGTDGLNDTITLTANLTFASAADALSINVTDGKTLTIVGAGFTIDAAYQARALSTATSGAGSAIELQNLTITHGRMSGNGAASGNATAGSGGLGGAISNSGTITLNGVNVTANAATGGGGGGGVTVGQYGGGGGGGSGANGIGGGNGGNAGLGGGPYSGVAGGAGNGGRGGGYTPTDMGGRGGTAAGGGAGGIGTFGYSNGGAGATASAGGITIGGGGGGAGWSANGGTGGAAAGAIYNTGTLTIIGTSVISNNIGAGGGGGGGGGAGKHGGIGGLGVGAIWNEGGGATVRITAANFAAMSGNSGASGTIGAVTNGGDNTGFSSPTAVANIYNGGGTVDTNYAPGPTVTDARISIAGASGTGGAYKIGDTVTATWNNTAGGDNNAGVTGVTVDFSQFGGGAAVAASNSGGTWTATYTIVAGAIDTTNRNVSVSATNGTVTTTADSSNATVDNVALTVSDARISISGASGTGGAYKIGDTVTASWNNTAGGDNNSDTVSAATVDFSQFGGGAAVAATNSGGTWTATYTITAGAVDAANRNVSVSATDNAGNVTTTADTSNASVDSVAPTLTDANISISGASGTGGAFRIGDTVTASWNNTAGGDNNSDTISAVTVDFSQFGGGAAVAASNSGGTWSATYTIVAGALQAANRNVSVTATDNAGNATSRADSSNATVDTVRPTATIVVADTALRIGETSLVTITFSEAVSGFTNADLTVANGTLGAVSSGDGGITWTATFTPTAAIADTSNVITLDNTGVTDAAGNTGSGTTDSNNYAIDTARPTATIVVADTALAVGETSLVTITFSEAVAGFTNADLTVANGTLGAVSSGDGGLTWSATFTPTAAITDTTNVITLDNTGVTDAAGNAGSGTTDSNNYAIDTLRPTATIVVADTALAAGETSLVTITFSEAVTGLTNADFTVANGTLGAVSSGDGGITWTATFTPAAAITDSTNLITLDNTGVIDAAGNAGSGTTDSNNYAIDTARPTATIVVADTALAIGETSLVTITFSEAVTGFTNADLTIANGTLGAVSSGDGGLTWTATFTPAAAVSDTTNVITLDNTGVTDAAGNAGSGTTDSNNYAIDTARPTATIVVADTALAIGETSLVTITFSEAVAGFTIADLTVANGTLGALSSGDGGVTWTATFTPTAAITDTTNVITLDNTGVVDGAGNAGSGSTDSNNYAIDTLRPTATIVVADTALMAGETSLVTFTFSEAVAGFTIADLTVANGTLGALSSGDGGVTWTATLTPTAGISDASNLITLDNTGLNDLAGNAGSGTTDSNNYTVDTQAPTATIVVADSALAAGETSLVTITFSGAVTGFSNADLTVANGTLSAVSSGDGGVTWTATLTPTAGITDTTNVITLDNTGVSDGGGNAGVGTTDSNNYAIDTARPSATIVVADTALAIGETSLVTITFSEAVTGLTNADFTVANGTLGAVSSGDGGLTWTATFTPTAAISDTTNVITLDNTGVVDGAGNAGSGTTDSNNYAVDTVRPTATIVVADTALAAGETSLVTITFSEAVTGLTNADFTVANGTLGAVSSGDGGLTWTATFTPTAAITDVSNVVTLDNTGVLDAAGNAGSGTTDSNNYAIDTARPTATIAVADTALAIGETSLVTITFSEAVTGFTNADLTIANGTLGAVSSGDGGITWTATFTPAAAVSDTTNVITLDNTGVTDAAGNAGSGTTDSNNYAIDTARPTATIVVADSALTIGETSLVTITFSEAVTGLTNADLTLANGTLGALSSGDGGVTWTATFTPTAAITDTTNVITLDNTGVVDGAGNAGSGSTASNNYAIDTLRPTATIVVADSALRAGETSLVTFTFSEAVAGFTIADLTVANGTLGALSSGDGGVTWTATLTPTAGISDATNLITLDNTGLNDLAGNAGSGTTDSNNYTVDTQAPTATIVVADSALAAGETSLVTITFSGAVSGFSNADLAVANGTLSAVSSGDGGVTWTATLTPTAGISDTTNVITLDNTGVVDGGGNAGVGTTDSNNYAIDTARPTATIVVADTALAIGETSLVTITFSEAVTGFTNADLTVANGTLGAVSSGDGGLTWSATFTPTAAITDTTNVITLDNTGVTDAAGNAGSGSTDSNNYAIDTLRPTATIVVADTALAAGETSLVTITFSEAVTGLTNADFTVANGTLGAVSSGDGGLTWTATFTPAAAITDSTNLITLDNTGVIDAAGNAGSGTTDSNNYAIDTARPTATIAVADTALAIGETSLVTITFSEAVTGLTNADFTVANGTLGALSTGDGGLTWTATFTPAAAVSDTTNVITLDNTGVTDAAGNAGSGTTDSNNYAIDTARPTATIVVADSALTIGETSLVTITFSEAVTGLTNADLTLANGTLGALSSGDGGLTWTATFTPTAAIADSSNVITLDNTGVMDAAGNAGSGTTDSNNYAIDTLPAATPAAPQLAAASDTGRSASDGITGDNTPLVTGSAADGTTITLYDSDGVTVLGSTVAAGGSWAITSAALSDGSHALTVVASKNGVNASARSAALQLVVDTVAPAAPGIPFTTGGPVSNDIAPVFSGTGAEPDALITLRAGATTIATAQADASGNWHAAPVVLGAGQFDITASATDAAGNTSAASGARTLTILAPLPPNLPPMPTLPRQAADVAREETANVSPVGLAVAAPFSRSPLAGTIAEAREAPLAFDLPPVLPVDEVQIVLPVDLFAGIALKSVRATLANGEPLPSWLTFDEENRSFHGDMPVGAPAGITVEVIGVDFKGKEHRAVFRLGRAIGERETAPAKPRANQAQAAERQSGTALLAALGLLGPRSAVPDGNADASGPASHLSAQLARAAQRFTHDAGATLQHLKQTDQAVAMSEQA